MEYYLPRDEDLERLEDAYSKPVGEEEYDEIVRMGEEDGGNPQIESIFPVRLLTGNAESSLSIMIGYGRMRWFLKPNLPKRSCYHSMWGNRSRRKERVPFSSRSICGPCCVRREQR
jgi:hypothetical protein